MVRKWLISGLVLILGSLAGWGSARAHPHVWVDTVTGFVVTNGKVTGLHLRWTFDELFSASLLEEFHLRAGKSLSPENIRSLENGAFRATAEQGYFTHIRLDGKPVSGLKPRDFSARLDGALISYEFILPLPQPIDPRTTRLSIVLYEQSYYVDVMPAERNPTFFEGDGLLTCRALVGEDADMTIFYGVHPARIDLAC